MPASWSSLSVRPSSCASFDQPQFRTDEPARASGELERHGWKVREKGGKKGRRKKERKKEEGKKRTEGVGERAEGRVTEKYTADVSLYEGAVDVRDRGLVQPLPEWFLGGHLRGWPHGVSGKESLYCRWTKGDNNDVSQSISQSVRIE